MIGFLVVLAIDAALFVLGRLLQPKPPKPKAEQVQPPRAQEGDAIPLLYGTQKVGPNCTWFRAGHPRARKVSNFLSSTTIGYRYYARAMMTFCLGPIDEIVDVVFEDVRYLSLLQAMPGAVSGDAFALITVTQSSLLGGDTGNGGLRGLLRVYRGTADQTPDDFMASANGQAQAVSAYRNVCYAVMKNNPVFEDETERGFWIGNSPTMPNFHLVLARFPSAAAGPAYRKIGSSANPAEAIYDILTSPFACNRPAAKVETADFTSAAQVLFGENLGINKLVPGQAADEAITDILDHIDGVVYTDPTTGRIRFKLARADYSAFPGELPEFSADDLADFTFSRAMPSEWLTEVNVNYTAQTVRPALGPAMPIYDTRTVRVQNPAAYFGLGEQKRTATLDMPLFSTQAAAYQAGLRYLKLRSTPVGKGSFTTNRKAFALAMGTVFVVRNPEQGVERVVCRVTNINYGSLDEPTIKIDFTEDIFSITGAETALDDNSAGPPSRAVAGYAIPVVHASVSQTPTTGTMTLDVVDDGGVVTLVEFGVQVGAGAIVYTPDTAPYERVVTLDPALPTTVYYRVTYTGPDGTPDTLEDAYPFHPAEQPAPPALAVSFSASGVATIRSTGDSLTATQKVASSTAGYPTDATVRAQPAQAGADVTVTGPTLTEGQTLYVAAFAYSAAGVESRKAILAQQYGSATAGQSGSASGTPGDVTLAILAPPGVAHTVLPAVPAAATDMLPEWKLRRNLASTAYGRLQGFVARALDAGATLRVQYSTNLFNYYDLGPVLPVSATGWIEGVWTALVAAGQTDVRLRLVAVGGDGATDLELGALYLDFTSNPTAPPPTVPPDEETLPIATVPMYRWRASVGVTADGAGLVTGFVDMVAALLLQPPDSANAPTFQAAVAALGGRPGLVSDSKVLNAAPSAVPATAFTLALVYTPDTVDVSPHGLCMLGNGNTSGMGLALIADQAGIYAVDGNGGTFFSAAGASIAAGELCVQIARYDAGAITVWRNAHTPLPTVITDIVNEPSAQIALGSVEAIGRPRALATIGEYIIFPSALADPEVHDLLDFLVGYYGGTVDTSSDTGGGSPPPPVGGSGPTYYVSPTGSAAGDGSAGNPWDLATAVTSASVGAGSRIECAAGTYGTPGTAMHVTVSGTATDPITIAPAAGARAIIDCQLVVDGDYVWLREIEVMDSRAAPPNEHGISDNGTGNKRLGCLVHDTGGNGISPFEAAIDSEEWGNIIYFCGRQTDVSGYAHGLYSQNLAPSTKKARGNIIFDCFGFGLHCYADAGHLDNYTVEDNIVFHCREVGTGWAVWCGGANALTNFIYRRNLAYETDGGRTLQLGVDYPYGADQSGGTVTDNLTYGSVHLAGWASLTHRRNEYMGATPEHIVLIDEHAVGESAGSDFDANTYWKADGGTQFARVTQGAASFAGTFSEWQGDQGFDATSVMRTTPPTGTRIQTAAHPYPEATGLVGVVGVLNFDLVASVAVNLASMLAVGDAYEIWHVFDWVSAPRGAALVTGTYSGGTVAIPMTTVAPPTPVSTPEGAPTAPGPRMGAFIVRRV